MSTVIKQTSIEADAVFNYLSKREDRRHVVQGGKNTSERQPRCLESLTTRFLQLAI